MFSLVSNLDASEAREMAWQEGVDYLNKFNDIYLSVIGARVSEEKTTEEVVACLCEDAMGKEWYWELNPVTGECVDNAPPHSNVTKRLKK